MTLKLLRILWLIPTSAALTLLVFAYRYIWFGITTVPGERAFAAFGILIFGGFICMISEMIISDNSSRW